MYNDESGYHFMNNETYEQVCIESTSSGSQFLKDVAELLVVFHAEEERPISATCPATEMEITYTEPGVKGDTPTP